MCGDDKKCIFLDEKGKEQYPKGLFINGTERSPIFASLVGGY